MKKIAFAFIAALAVLSFAGCKKKGGDSGEALAKWKEFEKEMCACKDKACADGVAKKVTEWGEKQPKPKADEKPKAPSPEMEKVTKSYGECMTKAMMAGATDPGATPPGGTPPGGTAPGTDPGAAPPGGTPPAGGEMKPEEKKEEPKMEEKKEEMKK